MDHNQAWEHAREICNFVKELVPDISTRAETLVEVGSECRVILSFNNGLLAVAMEEGVVFLSIMSPRLNSVFIYYLGLSGHCEPLKEYMVDKTRDFLNVIKHCQEANEQ